MPTIPKIAVGHDHGNTETTDYIISEPAPMNVYGSRGSAVEPAEGAILYKTFPSAVAIGSLIDLQSLRSGAGGKGKATKYEEIVISVNGGPEQFVGNLALMQARQAFTGRGDIHRYESERSLTTLLAACGSLVQEPEFEAFVVTGLPVETFKRGRKIREGAKEALKGYHHFVLNGKERRARIHVVEVLMEGAGGLIAYGLDGDDVRQSVLDMGGRTTDGVQTIGQDPVAPRCGGTARGVEDSKEMLSRYVERDSRYGRALVAEETDSILRAHIRIRAMLDLLSQREYQLPLKKLAQPQIGVLLKIQQELADAQAATQQYRITLSDIEKTRQRFYIPDLSLADLTMRYPTLHAHGVQIAAADLYAWTEKSLRSVGVDIASFASSLWNVGEGGAVASDNARVLAAGGGAYYYLEDVKAVIPEIMPCEYAELANAIGYAQFAYAALLEALGIQV